MFTHRYSGAVWLAIYLALQIGANFVSPPLRSPGALLALALFSAALFMFLSLAVCASLTSAIRQPLPALALLALGLLGLVPTQWAALFFNGSEWPRIGLHASHELFFILTAVGLGVLVANGVRDRNILLPAAVFAGFADYAVVNFGLVHWALTTPGKGQKLLNAMSAHAPVLHPGLPVLTVGFADFLFMAIFFACVYRFDLRLKATFIAFMFLLTLSLWFVLLRGAAVPALAPMALGFVSANFRCFKLSREELHAMAAAAAIVLIAALFLVLRQPHELHPARAPAKSSKRAAMPLSPASLFPKERRMHERRRKGEMELARKREGSESAKSERIDVDWSNIYE